MLVNIAVISDLHLGSDDPTDSFGHDDAEFLRFLGFLERNFERIVLLGDIWETLTSHWPWSAHTALCQARERHPEIARRLGGRQYHYVHGNHDLIAATEGAPEWLGLSCNGRRLLFTHGHGYDHLIRGARRLVELGVCLGGWIRRAGWYGMYQWFDRWEQSRGAVSVDPNSCGFQAWAVGLAQQRSADIIVTGHTHLPLATRHGHHLYLNSGACSQGRFSYLTLDTRRDQYGVHHSW